MPLKYQKINGKKSELPEEAWGSGGGGMRKRDHWKKKTVSSAGKG